MKKQAAEQAEYLNKQATIGAEKFKENLPEMKKQAAEQAEYLKQKTSAGAQFAQAVGQDIR